jgi:propanediol dehydratase small subunit
MNGADPSAMSGRRASELTVDAVQADSIGPEDLRIHPDVLEHQASIAEAHHNPQLAANLRRAAELTALDDEEIMAIYEALRPGRSTPAELDAIAASLATRGLTATAGLVREAATTYARRNLGR